MLTDSRYVAPADTAERARRLAPLGLKPDDVKAPSLVLKAGEHFVFSEANVAAKLFLHTLPTPQSLEELKAMVGVPNSVFEHNNSKHERIFPAVDVNALETDGASSLNDPSSAAHKVATNLTYSFAEPSIANSESHQTLVQLMCGAVGGMTAVAGGDLVVESGATVDLGPNPVVVFDRVIVHGTGRIIVHNNQKLSASSVQWLPN